MSRCVQRKRHADAASTTTMDKTPVSRVRRTPAPLSLYTWGCALMKSPDAAPMTSGNDATTRGSSLATGSAPLDWLKPSDGIRRWDRAEFSTGEHCVASPCNAISRMYRGLTSTPPRIGPRLARDRAVQPCPCRQVRRRAGSRRAGREEIDHLGVFAEPCFVLRTSRTDDDVTLPAEPLFRYQDGSSSRLSAPT